MVMCSIWFRRFCCFSLEAYLLFNEQYVLATLLKEVSDYVPTKPGIPIHTQTPIMVILGNSQTNIYIYM
jgi:hypothetical protein